ncbi:hypothetical protein NLG97_g8111 [Lecanicillium saksenae]|uniref:Uncharacterized protein n=1 Tax=Lecanicillium saksenae TaxID=468837 RepID=A0ACC1QN53_9HYPO|nr:hypothetical protein NLG97_g8111 [Lecanicillium saksenae]
MARLNEPALSTDNIEILRKKMLRQNRELAKNNNIRALRVRELESELSRALTENLELRSRIVELEHEAQDNDARRIADHALAIKEQLEAQLTEWGTLVAGLGLDPPTKRHSPRISKTSRPRMSFAATRPSPSQRRLRDIANEVEQLGHIAEHKAYSRKSMNPEQIRALRSEAQYEEPPELPRPAPVVDEQPTKVDTPPRESRARNFSSGLDSSPLVVSSPNLDNLRIGSASPMTSMTPMIRESRVHVDSMPDTPIAPPTKPASKRKFNKDEYEPMTMEKITDENVPPRVLTQKVSILNKAHGKTLKELAVIRRDAARAKAEAPRDARPALAAKSTNDDMQSPKKRKIAPADDVSSLKMKNKASKPKSKAAISIKIDEMLPQRPEPVVTSIEPSSLAAAAATPSPLPAVMSSCSPEPSALEEQQRDTPPPGDIGFMGEASRPSRRSRAAISYAEPNLRDKMRRPRDEKFDAVSGEGKSRRFSQSEISSLDVKRESGGSDSWQKLPAAHPRISELSTGSAPVSPLSDRASSPKDLPASVQAGRRKRISHAQVASDESDVYEFTSSSPNVDENGPVVTKRTSGRKITASRRFSAAMDSDEDGVGQRFLEPSSELVTESTIVRGWRVTYIHEAEARGRALAVVAPAVEEGSRRAGVSPDQEFKLEGEARQATLNGFEAALGDLAKLYNANAEGPFILGKQVSYADFIVGAWLRMFVVAMPKDEWQRLKSWHNGTFGRLHDALDAYAQIK